MSVPADSAWAGTAAEAHRQVLQRWASRIPTIDAMRDNTVVRSFDSLDAGAAAVNQLVQAGFEHGAIELRVLETEAGPGQGNFYVGNGVTSHGGRPEGVLAGGEVPYDQNFRHPASRSMHLVIVTARSPQEHAKAGQVLEAAGGRDVQDIADSALHG